MGLVGVPFPRTTLHVSFQMLGASSKGRTFPDTGGPIVSQEHTSSSTSLPALSNKLPMLISEPAVPHSHLYGSCCLPGKASLQNLPTRGQSTLHYLITSFLSHDDLLGFSLLDSLCPPLLWRNTTHLFRDPSEPTVRLLLSQWAQSLLLIPYLPQAREPRLLSRCPGSTHLALCPCGQSGLCLTCISWVSHTVYRRQGR